MWLDFHVRISIVLCSVASSLSSSSTSFNTNNSSNLSRRLNNLCYLLSNYSQICHSFSVSVKINWLASCLACIHVTFPFSPCPTNKYCDTRNTDRLIIVFLAWLCITTTTRVACLKWDRINSQLWKISPNWMKLIIKSISFIWRGDSNWTFCKSGECHSVTILVSNWSYRRLLLLSPRSVLDL